MEIESKERAILEIKRIRLGLTEEERKLFEKLESICRDEIGHLKKGCFFINADSLWEKVK